MKRILQVLVPVVILAVGVGLTAGIMRLKPQPQKATRTLQAPTVDVLTVQRDAEAARIYATGIVEPARQVSLSAEVNGRVVWVSDGLVPGGRVSQGQALVRLDSRDYELAVRQQESVVEQARLALELEKNQQDVVKKEWALLGNDKVKPSALALREPQVKTAEVAVRAAESSLERARLALERTTVRAPFNALVVTEQMETGQFAGPGAPFASLIGTDTFWVTAQIPIERLVYLHLASEAGQEGSEVTVVQDLGGEGRIEKKGRALRLKGGLDPATRTAQVVVGIDNPLDPEPGASGTAALPLLPGAFVEILFDGKKMEDTWRIPRTALADGDRVWIVDKDDQLRRADVTIAWRTNRDVFVTSGLEDGQRVVTSPLSLPIEGMKVEVATRSARSEDVPDERKGG